jgi:proline iminopeptidase
MPPIPPPRADGFTASTPVPLYWAAYGPRGGAPLLVLHGGPGADHAYLLPQMLALADRRGMVFYDQRGGGRSTTGDRAPITWRIHVEDLDRVIAELETELGAGPVTIVGYSWGALLAMLFAIEAGAGRAAHRPRRLVLIDPAPVTREYRAAFEAEFARRQSDAHVAQLRADLAASMLRERDPASYRHRAFELSVAGYFADPSRARDLTAFRVAGRVQNSVWDSLGDYDLLAPGQLNSIASSALPALVVHGRQDPIPLASSEAVARTLNARLVVLDDCGHVPYVEQPAALFAAVRGFLNATE